MIPAMFEDIVEDPNPTDEPYVPTEAMLFPVSETECEECSCRTRLPMRATGVVIPCAPDSFEKLPCIQVEVTFPDGSKHLGFTHALGPHGMGIEFVGGEEFSLSRILQP